MISRLTYVRRKHIIWTLVDFSELYLNSKIINNSNYFGTTSLSAFPLLEGFTMDIFDRNAKLLQKERAGNASDIQVYDYLKDEVGCRLVDRMFDIKKTFRRALDLGCGRGHVSKHISKESVEQLILADMSPTLLNQAEIRKDVKVQRMAVDEEKLSVEPDSIDLVISCLSLHWINNLPKCFKCINDCLKQDGVFLAAIFGGDTLYELRGSLQLAELEREGGISPHISPFVEIRDVGSLLIRTNFTMLTIDIDQIVIGYPSMFELMWDLKGMGENNAIKNRKLHLKRDTLMAAAAIYKELYGKTKEDGTSYIPSTFQIIYMIGWKPHPSQPKPLERGTGQISLKDLHNLDKIIKETNKMKVDKDK